MPRSIVVVPTTSNLIYEAESEALDPASLSNVSNQNKYLRNTAGSLEWRANNVANGVVELNSLGLIDNTLLPSYVDDVLTYATSASFPVTGETGKIYVDESNGYSYRWTGSTYYNISTQSFYTKTQLDATFDTKLNLSGGTMTGAIAMGTNNISGIGTASGTTATFTNVNPSNLGACTLTGTLTTGAQAIYGVTGAVDVLNLKATNLRSRDDVISATMETGGALTLQQNMNANSKNISSVATLYFCCLHSYFVVPR